MTTDPPLRSGTQPFATLRSGAFTEGYLQHAARHERAVGWVLWIGLLAVLLLAGA